MDQAYLRAHPEHLPTFLTHQRIRETPVGGGSVSNAVRLTLDDGTSLFAKTWPSGEPPRGFFEAEASGLRWLAEAGAPVPEVFVALPSMLATGWIDHGPATPAAAERLGRDLAALHRSGAESFGAEWPGFIGPLPLDNTRQPGPWGRWFAERRLRPYVRTSADSGALTAQDVALLEEILSALDRWDDGEPPSRTHGDLWPGNILWSSDGTAYLIDPAAQGAHRETDLAEMSLFGGAPHLDRILGAYRDAFPLADGWQARVPLHQLHLLLVHTAAFGAAYRNAVVTAARSAHAALS
ncbi:fructosamine kinase family protein [Actinoplanes sp. CA-030573]|uniref:fructosamine kinase family protein n=1 Tax=Actinoplanes sp. CA-030573 TaxID=3239898 RepID=UPI003D90B62E